ncbi:MAG: hypothetical protein ACREAC_22715, partial [Blastocatellia bacterium]
ERASTRATHVITVDVTSRVPTIVEESLHLVTGLFGGKGKTSFKVKGPIGLGRVQVYVRRPSSKKALGPVFTLRNDRPSSLN